MLRDRSQLGWCLPTGSDSDGNPNVWLNCYECPGCGQAWEDSWSCQCDDECPDCGDDVSPERSIWMGPEDTYLKLLWEILPEKGVKKDVYPVDRAQVLFELYAEFLWDKTDTVTENMARDLAAFGKYLGEDALKKMKEAFDE